MSVRGTCAVLAAVAAVGLAAGARPGPAGSAAPVSVVANGDFQWPAYTGRGVVAVSAGVPIGSIPTDWYGGPGQGATAVYDIVPFPPGQRDVPGRPAHHLRIAWRKAPAAGETQHAAAFRFTFLEYFGIRDARVFSGKTVEFSFYARIVDADRAAVLDIVPIIWHSYDPNVPARGKGYELFESSGRPGVTAIAQGPPDPRAVCRITTRWRRYVRRFAIPDVSRNHIAPGHYTGVGFDRISGGAPTIDLAHIEVREVASDPARRQ